MLAVALLGLLDSDLDLVVVVELLADFSPVNRVLGRSAIVLVEIHRTFAQFDHDVLLLLLGLIEFIGSILQTPKRVTCLFDQLVCSP